MPEARFQLAGGDRNVGTAYLPEDRPAPLPALIVCFGRKLTPFTAELSARGPDAGLAVVTFDVYGWGETGGDLDGWTYGRLAANLADVCAYVGAQEWADGRRIGALGISAGSTAVLRCAIDAQQLAVGVAVAAFLGHYVAMPDGPAKQLIDHLETLVAGGTIQPAGWGLDYHLGLDFYKDALGGAPIYRLHTISCPILFLQGGADNVYRRSDARLGYELPRSHGLPASCRARARARSWHGCAKSRSCAQRSGSIRPRGGSLRPGSATPAVGQPSPARLVPSTPLRGTRRFSAPDRRASGCLRRERAPPGARRPGDGTRRQRAGRPLSKRATPAPSPPGTRDVRGWRARMLDPRSASASASE